MSYPIQTAAVAAALSGERAHETVSFPTTGDAEADLLVGVLALAKTKITIPRGARSRILRCLADRFEKEEEPVEFNPTMFPGVLGDMGGSAPNPYTPWLNQSPYQTTGGLGGGQMQGSNAQYHSSAQSLINQTQPAHDTLFDGLQKEQYREEALARLIKQDEALKRRGEEK